MKARISKEVMEKRLNNMLELREMYLNDIENVHIKLQKGNEKTGVNCFTISLLPIIDCTNCSECKGTCYDINNVCRFKSVINDRARNSALHLADINRFWEEVNLQVKANFVTQLRINVGGDLTYDDFKLLNNVAKENPHTDFLFFTKSYDDINRFLSEEKFESNVHSIISRWIGLECNNEFNLPESHVLFEDGSTTAPEYGSNYCKGNCSGCHMYKEGCWTLKNGESVIFKAH